MPVFAVHLNAYQLLQSTGCETDGRGSVRRKIIRMSVAFSAALEVGGDRFPAGGLRPERSALLHDRAIVGFDGHGDRTANDAAVAGNAARGGRSRR